MAAKLILCFILAILGILFWVILLRKRFYHPNVSFYPVFFSGILSALPIVLLGYMNTIFPDAIVVKRLFEVSSSTPILTILAVFIVVGILEENAKFVSVVHASRNKSFGEHLHTSVIIGVYVALGFTFIENYVYLLRVTEQQGIMPIIFVFLVRTFIATFAHILFSGIVGYHFGRTHVLRNNVKNVCSYAKRLFIGLKRYIIISQGLLLAIVFHVGYDLFVHYKLTYLVVPLLIGGFLIFQQILMRNNAFIQLQREPETETNDSDATSARKRFRSSGIGGLYEP